MTGLTCSYVLLLVKVLMTGLTCSYIITCKSVNDRSDCSLTLLLVKVLMTGLSVVMYYYL